MRGHHLRHTLALDRWSRQSSPVHALTAVIKLSVTLIAVIAISFTGSLATLAEIALAPVLVCLLARLPLAGVALRAGFVLPFSGVFVIATWLQGDPDRALMLLSRSYLSALWSVLLVATTPMEQILRLLVRMGAPPLFTDVVQFLWRYLHVVVEQASRLRTAALARGASRTFGVAAGSIAVLFSSSYARAERIHRAMLARGVTGGRR